MARKRRLLDASMIVQEAWGVSGNAHGPTGAERYNAGGNRSPVVRANMDAGDARRTNRGMAIVLHDALATQTVT
eukprot:11185053-Lingulodinium_polyedra.AAC.1